MGFLSSIFGSKPKSETKAKSTLSPQQQAILSQVAGYFGDKGSIAQAGEPFSGEITAGASPLQETSLAALEQRALDGVGDTGQAAGDALQKILSGDTTTDINEYFQRVVQDPLLEDFPDIQSRISRTYAPSGFYGSERLKADEQSREDLLDTLTKERARVGFEARGDDLNRIIQAASISGDVESASINPLLQLLEAGGVQRGIGQEKLTGTYQEFIRQKADKDLRLKRMLEALGISTSENITTVDPGSSGLLGALAPIAGSYLGGPGGAALTSAFLAK